MAPNPNTDPAYTRSYVELPLGQCHRRWTNVNLTSGKNIVLAGDAPHQYGMFYEGTLLINFTRC